MKRETNSLIGQIVAVNVLLVVTTLFAASAAASLDLRAHDDRTKFALLALTIVLVLLVNMLMLRRRFSPLEQLIQEIEAIDPRVIVTLGRFSMARFFPGEKISRIHGVAKRHGDRMVLPLYHPAAALHQNTLRRTVEEDFRRLPAILEAARKLSAPAAPVAPAAAAAPDEPEPKQLSLF